MSVNTRNGRRNRSRRRGKEVDGLSRTPQRKSVSPKKPPVPRFSKGSSLRRSVSSYGDLPAADLDSRPTTVIAPASKRKTFSRRNTTQERKTITSHSKENKVSDPCPPPEREEGQRKLRSAKSVPDSLDREPPRKMNFEDAYFALDDTFQEMKTELFENGMKNIDHTAPKYRAIHYYSDLEKFGDISKLWNGRLASLEFLKFYRHLWGRYWENKETAQFSSCTTTLRNIAKTQPKICRGIWLEGVGGDILHKLEEFHNRGTDEHDAEEGVLTDLFLELLLFSLLRSLDSATEFQNRNGFRILLPFLSSSSITRVDLSLIIIALGASEEELGSVGMKSIVTRVSNALMEVFGSKQLRSGLCVQDYLQILCRVAGFPSAQGPLTEEEILRELYKILRDSATDIVEVRVLLKLFATLSTNSETAKRMKINLPSLTMKLRNLLNHSDPDVQALSISILDNLNEDPFSKDPSMLQGPEKRSDTSASSSGLGSTNSSTFSLPPIGSERSVSTMTRVTSRSVPGDVIHGAGYLGEWTSADVQKWLTENELGNLRKNFNKFDGPALNQLRVLYLRQHVLLHSTLDFLKIKNPRDVLRLTNALEKL